VKVGSGGSSSDHCWRFRNSRCVMRVGAGESILYMSTWDITSLRQIDVADGKRLVGKLSSRRGLHN